MKKLWLFNLIFLLVLFIPDSRAEDTLSGHTGRVYSVSFSPDGTLLASGSWDGTVKLWDVSTGQEKATLTGHTGRVLSVSFSPDGTLLASGAYDGTVKLWDVSSAQEKATLTGHRDLVFSVSFSPDGTLLASGSYDDTVKLWDVSTGQEKATLTGHTSRVYSVSFSPDGTLLASGSWDGTVKLWDVSSAQEKATLTRHTGNVNSVSFSPDGTLLASGSSDGTVKLWDVNTGQEKTTLTGHTGDVLSVSFSPDGTLLASGSGDRTVKLWDVSTGQVRTTLTGHTVSVRSVSFSPDGTLLASGSWDGTVKLWDMGPRPHRLVKISRGYQRGTPGAALPNPLIVEVRDQYGNPLPDVQVTFTVIEGGGKLSGQFTVEQAITDANGRAERTLTLGPGPETYTLVRASIAGDKQVTFRAGTLSDEGDYWTWHVPNGVIARLGKGSLGRSDRPIAFSPDSQYLAVASSIGIWLYDVATSRELTLLPTTSFITSVSFSSDGTLLASGSLDDTVKLWDVSTGQEKTTLTGHTDDVFSVSFLELPRFGGVFRVCVPSL